MTFNETKSTTPAIAVVIPNWNGKDSIGTAITSLLNQSVPAHIIVVENGSTDGSAEFIRTSFPEVELIIHEHNLGFDGGVNAGIRRALENKTIQYVALFNNDAVADPTWLEYLYAAMQSNPQLGIATGKLMDMNGEHFDSTGEQFTTWGLSFPRGRGEPVSDIYDTQTMVFGATGGASLYRTDLFRAIGIFDEDFFAYYEDVDISFRAQLAGWQVQYVPLAITRHQISATGGKIKGFFTYQTMKNIPWVVWKNVPWRLMPTILPRFMVAYILFCMSAIQRGQGLFAIKGMVISFIKWPKKLMARHKIQKNRKVSAQYIQNLLIYDLPPNAYKLRTLRRGLRKLTFRKTA
jgi:GT2 family glycosyltransferase